MEGIARDGGEELGKERVLEGRVVDEGDVEVTKGGFYVMLCFFFFCEVGGECALGGSRFED